MLHWSKVKISESAMMKTLIIFNSTTAALAIPLFSAVPSKELTMEVHI